MTQDQRTMKECKPCDGLPYPSPPWMGWDAKQDSYKRNSSESNGDLVNISRTRPLGAECLVSRVTFVFYTQGELAAIIWTISHFTMRTWTRDTCGSEFAETGKTVFQGYLSVEDFRWSNHKPKRMEWRLKRSEGRHEYAPVIPPGRNNILQVIWTWLLEKYDKILAYECKNSRDKQKCYGVWCFPHFERWLAFWQADGPNGRALKVTCHWQCE